ncbi:hypothetical protein NliqN6_1096 [Naganishia liquefaciens]|uniref:lytic cellulose monooxygenase (C4-dehydrogenating) n=1 Tax=Naganishia liquefaciens TaxID=104408 RepID=A0A8H3TR01_9TREE|nr:hypothetical protein NliqN6_1096 [Naganishia liquefaciens]
MKRFQTFFEAILSATLSASFVNAHGYISQFYINDKVRALSLHYTAGIRNGPSLLNIQGIGNIMEIGTPQLPAHNPSQGPTNQPPGLLTAALAIGGDGTNDTRGRDIKSISATAKGGDTVTILVERLTYIPAAQTGHMGGSWNMMASCDGSCEGKTPEDLSWFKISEDNYDPSTKQWPLVIPGPGWGIARSFTLPTSLPGGEYLLSCTLLALHSAAAPQYYPTAWRVKLAASSVQMMPKFESNEIGKIPDMYTKMRNDASTFNINQDLPEKFALPGVKIWRGSDSVIKNAKDFVPKPITGAAVPQVGAAVPQVQGQAETAIPPPPQDTGSLAPQTGGKGDQVAHCGSDFTNCLEQNKGNDIKLAACPVALSSQAAQVRTNEISVRFSSALRHVSGALGRAESLIVT